MSMILPHGLSGTMKQIHDRAHDLADDLNLIAEALEQMPMTPQERLSIEFFWDQINSGLTSICVLKTITTNSEN